MNGTLGVGKTRLVQAVAQALGVPDGAVTSPTFVLINEYRGRLPVYHFDAYRLRDMDEFAQLGPEEYFFGDGVCFVEWAERVAAMLPVDRLEIDIESVGENQRVFRITGYGDKMQEIVTDLAARVPQAE
jgi:tRNA threonylcarbamoyladenosine biosynthesis protein TsaE